MARLRDNVLPPGATNSLTLDRYQEIMLIDINAFNGLLKVPAPDTRCVSILTQSERDRIGMWIQAAEEMRFAQLGYYLSHKYTAAEEQPFTLYNPYLLANQHLYTIGLQTTVDIEIGATVTLGTDPATVSVVTSVGTSEIVVYYPGEDVEIHPTVITASGGTVTITIPWARLVKPSLNDDREDHLKWQDKTNYLTTVDIKRVYYDASQGVEFVWRPGVNCGTDCTESTQPACHNIIGERANRISSVSVHPATWDGDTPTVKRFTYTRLPDYVRFNYTSGIQTMVGEFHTARLMHTLTPQSPCNCQTVNNYWIDDRIPVPGTVTPYGSYKASVDVFIADSQAKVGVAFSF